MLRGSGGGGGGSGNNINNTSFKSDALNISSITVEQEGVQNTFETKPMTYRRRLIKSVEGGKFIPKVDDALVEDASNLLNSMHDEMYSVRKRTLGGGGGGGGSNKLRPSTASAIDVSTSYPALPPPTTTSSLGPVNRSASAVTINDSTTLSTKAADRPPSSRRILLPKPHSASLIKVRDVVGPRRSSLSITDALLNESATQQQAYQPTLQTHVMTPSNDGAVKLRHVFPKLKANIRSGSAKPTFGRQQVLLDSSTIDPSIRHPDTNRVEIASVEELVEKSTTTGHQQGGRSSPMTRNLVPRSSPATTSRGVHSQYRHHHQQQQSSSSIDEDAGEESLITDVDPDMADWRSIIQRGAASRDLVAERAKTLEWLKYWGDVHKLREAGMLLNERLGISEATNEKLQDEIEWLHEQLANSDNQVKDISTMYQNADSMHGRMMLIERDKFTSVQDENVRLSSQLGDIRRKLVSAEAATERMALDLQESEDRAERLELDLGRAHDSHSVEMYKLKTQFQEKVDLFKSVQNQLEAANITATTASEKLMAQTRTVELLQGDIKTLNEKLSAAQQQGSSAFLRKFGTQLDQSTVQQLLKFSRTQGDVVERIASLTDGKKAAISSRNAFFKEYQLYSQSMEMKMMDIHDVDCVTNISHRTMTKMLRKSHHHASSSSSPQASPPNGRSSKYPTAASAAVEENPNFDQIIMRKIPGREAEGAIGRKFAKSPFQPVVNEYRNIFFDDGLPKVASGVQQVIQHVWKAYCDVVPPQLREGVYLETKKMLVDTVEGPLKDMIRAHVMTLDKFATVEEEVACKKVEDSIAKSVVVNGGKSSTDLLEGRVKEANATIETLKATVNTYQKNLTATTKFSQSVRKALEELVEKSQFELGVVVPSAYETPSFDKLFPGVSRLSENEGGGGGDSSQLMYSMEKTAAAVDRFCTAVRYDFRQRKRASELDRAARENGGSGPTVEDHHEEAQRDLKLQVAAGEKKLRELSDKLDESRNEVKSLRAIAASGTPSSSHVHSGTNHHHQHSSETTTGGGTSSKRGGAGKKGTSNQTPSTPTTGGGGATPQSTGSILTSSSTTTTSHINAASSPIATPNLMSTAPTTASTPTTATTVSFKQPSSTTKSPRREGAGASPAQFEDKSVQCSIMSLKGWIKRVPLSRSPQPNHEASFRSGDGRSSPGTHAFLRRSSLSPNPQSLFQEPYKSPAPIPFGDGVEGSSRRGSRQGSLSLGRTPSPSAIQHPLGGTHYKLDGMWGDGGGSLVGGDGSSKSAYSHSSTPSFRPVSTLPAETRDHQSPQPRSASPQPHYHQSGHSAARSSLGGSLGPSSSTWHGVPVDLRGQQSPSGERTQTAAMSINRRMEDAKRRAVEEKFVVAKDTESKTSSRQADSLMSQLRQRRAGGGSGGAISSHSRGRGGGSRPSSHQPTSTSVYDRFTMPTSPTDGGGGGGGGFLQVTPLH